VKRKGDPATSMFDFDSIIDYDNVDDDDSQSTVPNGSLEAHSLISYNITDYGDGYNHRDESEMTVQWKERYRTRLSSVEIQNVHPRMIELQLGVGDDVILRDFCFDSPHEVETFVKVFEKMRDLQHERGSRLAMNHQLINKTLESTPENEPIVDFDDDDCGGEEQKKEQQKGTTSAFVVNNPTSSFTGLFSKKKKKTIPNSVNLLIEIVSATNLPIADLTSSDPYVCVEDGRKEWHRTGYISKSLNPVWTLLTGSLFLIQTTLNDFFLDANRIEFIVKDYTVGDNDTLGSVLVNKNDLLAGEGERINYELTTKQHTGKNRVAAIGHKKSYLTLRCKTATKDEIEFMHTFEAKKSRGYAFGLNSSRCLTGVFTEDSYLPPQYHRSPLLKKYQRKAKGGVAIQYRIKPFPDPFLPEQDTKWLTKSEIERKAMEPSKQWIEAGSGSVGKFFVEIIGCDGLPNVDVSITGRNKSDPFVCIAFEDCFVNTDVINDCLSPRWMPWTQRSFIFNVNHPSSQLNIAVMDYDEFLPGSPMPSHDKLGRCCFNPTNVRTNTSYTLRFSLFDSDEVDRRIVGKITLRFRYESTDERQILLSAFQFRNHYSVSTNRKSDSTTTQYALTNDYDRYSLSLNTIQKYVDEIMIYADMLDDIVDALKVVVLWRGHFPLKFYFCKKMYRFNFPFHSILAFTWGIILSNDFDKIFSFICFWFAWILLATLEYRRNNPNPWKKPRTYLELLGILLFNKSYVNHKIAVNENIEEIMDFDERRAERWKIRKEAIHFMQLRNEFDTKTLEKESKEVEKQAHNSENIMSVGYNQIILAPFKDILMPVQILLYKTCVILRVASSIVTWRDSVIAFWLVTVAFVLSFIMALIPWSFLFRWTFRLLIWTFLGPWMKLVDIFFVENFDNMTANERNEKIEADYKKRYALILGESRLRRLQTEHSMKLHDMEKYMFGQYMMRVPIFKEKRFISIPLAGGSAVPYNPKTAPPVNIVKRINGQLLQGEMIPKRGKLATTMNNSSYSIKVPSDINIAYATTSDEAIPLLDTEDVEVDTAQPVYGTVAIIETKETQVMKKLAFDLIV